MAYLGLPLWQEYLIKGILAFVMLASSAVVLTRAGKNPYLAFLMAFPFVQIAAVWLFAYVLWKKKRTENQGV